MLHRDYSPPVTCRAFDSRDPRYRDPCGAVAADTPIHFRVCLPRSLDCRGVKLLVTPDGKAAFDWGLFWCGMEGEDHEWWECHFAPAAPGLYYYRFILDTSHGPRQLVRGEGGAARIADTGWDSWQITCYGKDFVTPRWLSGGVMYQIFPDRFAGDGEKKAGVPADRVLHETWGEQPVWRPDGEGKVRNNDYFGGSLKGIRQKLPYLKSLGVTCLYLNPIFEAHSNHRYDTADYEKIDPLLGEEADFRALCREAAAAGIRVLLDGVFSHTGADSRYFDRYGRYGGKGAYHDPESPYRPWYDFRRWPEEYASWWGFETLPEVRETEPSYLQYITGEGGVARRWLAAGASGWRLDVADELPDGFLDALRRGVKAEKPDALILGEVWEDASNKESYGHRRRYLLGDQLDSVMNYPFANAIYAYLGGGGAESFFRPVEDLLEHYPPQVIRVLMNPLTTHDTPRAITLLAGEPAGRRDREWQAAQRLTHSQRQRGILLLKMASLLQYCLPGVPCLYYGDEAGMEGYRDPFNRGCYPWGEEEEELIAWYRQLGALRGDNPVLREGAFARIPCGEEAAAFTREDERDGLLCAVNPGGWPVAVPLPERFRRGRVILGSGRREEDRLLLPPGTGAVLRVGSFEG